MIDEAQRVPDIGLNLKILVDSFPQARFLAIGSASFDLANRIHEPLTGQMFTVTLYPLAYGEIHAAFSALETHSQLERWLVWGSYPTVATESNPDMRARLHNEITGVYLYRNMLEQGDVRHADKVVALLRLLAFQIGQGVSVAELATNLGMSRSTVERYLDLLEKLFVIFRLGGFSRNLRKEVTKSARYYFFDNGIRTSLIQNFNPLHLRADVGQLWENYLMIERRKANALSGRQVNAYFWRTYDQKEIDYVEEVGGRWPAARL
ncbi:MAG: ATP-binding protein [Methylacidiphilales bacterium]|nr:ATP-binding protein [Candidatus Methylacidiphilales bacterium]